MVGQFKTRGQCIQSGVAVVVTVVMSNVSANALPNVPLRSLVLANQLNTEGQLATPPTRLASQSLSTTTNLSGEWILEPQFNEPPLSPLPPLPPNSNAPAAPTDQQALYALTKRYGCIVGYPDTTSPSRRKTTRVEFAAGLNACIDRFEELVAGGTVINQADLSTLHGLEATYADKLAYVRLCVAQLEERTRRLERQQAFQAFEADLLATLKLPAMKFKNEPLLKPQPIRLRTEPTPPPAPPNGSELAPMTDFQALAPVMQRYGCLVGFFDQFSDRFRTYKLTRFEFAAALNNCVDRVNELVVGGSVVRQKDLLTLKQLEAAYSGELAVLRFRIDALEAKIKNQEQPFSPTTKLHIETTLELSGTARGNR